LACDSIAPAPDLQRIILTQLDRLPYWLVFWASVTTIISGYLYIRKYDDLLRREFAILKVRPAKEG